jgi:hypothetical protein
MILSFHHAHGLAQGLGAFTVNRGMPLRPRTWRGGTLTMPPTRRCGHGERVSPERHPSGGEGVGMDAPTGSGSSGEGEEEGEISPPPLCFLCVTPPPLSDIISWQVGAMVSKR